MPSRLAVRRCIRRKYDSFFIVLLMLLGPQVVSAVLASPIEAQALFMPSADLDLPMLKAAIQDRSAVLQADLLERDLRRAEARQSRLFDNPVLDAAVGTIPVGPANPPDLPAPLQNIPNYAVGVSLHPDLARRSARIDRAGHLLRAADFQLSHAVRIQALGLLRKLGELAVATLRLTADQRLVIQARASLGLARDRVRTGFGPPLDGDRAEIELLRLEQQVAADQGDTLAAQAACADYVGVRCAPFSDENEARRFLSRWIQQERVFDLQARPDLRALAAQHDSAIAEAQLARSQRIPDPTLRLGYMYDTFVVSGNQQHSLNVALSLPLPFSDHGQASEQAAQARVHRYAEQRRLSLAASEARSQALQSALQLQAQRLFSLQQQVVPRGQAILRDVRRAFEARAVPLTDLNQAQRALDELLLQEATALGDVFRLSVDLLELGGDHA